MLCFGSCPAAAAGRQHKLTTQGRQTLVRCKHVCSRVDSQDSSWLPLAVSRRIALTGAAGIAAFGQQLPSWALRTVS